MRVRVLVRGENLYIWASYVCTEKIKWVNLTHSMSLALVPKNTHIEESIDSLTPKWVFETLMLSQQDSQYESQCWLVSQFDSLM